jgi:tryptophan-rich sensory protein
MHNRSLFVISGVIAETICAGKGPGGVMKNLHQPRWALPMGMWYAVGVFYYVLCFTVVYRVETSGRASTPLMLLIGLMLANALWNLTFFRLRALRWSLWFYVPYILFVATLIDVLWSVDRVSATLLLVYSAYLPYALAWSYFILKLNPRPRTSV